MEMNQLITTAGQPATMTSLELVEFINEDRKERAYAFAAPFPGNAFPWLEHKNFLAKVPDVLGATSAEFEANLPDSYGRPRRGYRFPKREACLMAMSYSYELQAKVFDRMTELEAATTKVSLLPDFNDPVASARAWADAKEAEQKAIALEKKAAEERDEAIRTKAMIGSKREASAMAKASAKSKEVERLKHELGRNQLHATVKAVKKMTGTEYCWRKLKKHCADNGLEARNVVDEQYGSVKAWPAMAWRDVHGIELSDIFKGDQE